MTAVLLAAGREADVYALDERRVLRRYRRDADVTGEAGTMRRLAGLGYPVPAVYEAGGRDMVLERLHGPTMAEALSTGTMGAQEAAEHLAALLRRLHDIAPWPDLAGDTPGPASDPPGLRLVHLDLHPENVVVTRRGPVVLDWCNARAGEPDLDTGLTALIIAQVAVDRAHPWSAPADALVAAFLRVAPGDPRRLLERVVTFRRWQLTGATPYEMSLIDAAAGRIRACAR